MLDVLGNWNSVILYDLAKFQNGRPFRPEETTAKDGVPVIKIAEMNRGVTSRTGRYGGEIEDRFRVEPGDLLFSWSGSIVIQRWQGPTGVLNQHIFKVTARSGVGQRFLEYLLRSLVPHFMSLVADQRTTMGHVRVADLKQTSVLLPSLDEQIQIGELLGSLDDKISSNRRVIDLSDERAQALWQLRFVEQSEDTWPSVSLSEICASQYGITTSAVDNDEGPYLLRVTDINKQNWIDWYNVPHCIISSQEADKCRLGLGDIVVARMADPGKAAIIEDDVDAVAASYLVRLRTASLAHAYYVYGFLKSQDYFAYARATTSGSVQKNMNARVIVGAKLCVPPIDLLNEHLQEIRPLRVLITHLVRENRTLEVLRDTLLSFTLSNQLCLRRKATAMEPVR
jgi:type I restriction enzyme S subunit